MSWQDEFIPASLNGVPFFVESATKTGGRRSQAHEFADVNGAWVEDSGQTPNRYPIKAFVVGDDYHVTLQELEDVLEAGGDLEFDHPRRGRLPRLRLEGEYQTEETKAELGYATISFTLVQNGQPEPLIFESTAAQVRLSGQRVRTKAAELFTDSYTGRDPFSVASRALRRVSKSLRGTYGKGLAKFGPVAGVRDAVDDFDSSLDTIVALPNAIVSQFGSLVQSLTTLFGEQARELGRPDEAPAFLADFAVAVAGANKTTEAVADYDSATGGADNTDPVGNALDAKKDFDALEVFAAAAAFAAFAEQLVDLDLPNAEAADALIELFEDELDQLLEATIGVEPISSDLYDALFALKVDVAKLLSEVGGELPSVRVYVPPTTVPVTILAYHQYGETGDALADRVASIVDLNDFDDPMFVADGTEVRVVVQ